MSETSKLTIFLLAIFGSASCFSLAGSCVNQVITEYPSPSGDVRLIVFERSCGATTDFSTQASLVPRTTDLPNDGGNVFIADTDHGAVPTASWGGPDLGVAWLSDNRLELSHHCLARIFLASNTWQSIQIEYAECES